jgi:hypothetical protein
MKPKPSRPKRQTAGEFVALQRRMARAIMRPLTDRGGMQPKWVNGSSTEKLVRSFIKPNDRMTSFERLEVYNRQYWFRLKDCFYDDYTGLRAVLGDRRFERLACAYLARHPSQSYSLRNLGRRLVGFLEEEPRWILPCRQLALDMARLEWAHIEAFDNEAERTLEIDALIGVDPARIRLKLQPHLTLLHLHYELDGFLIQIKRDEGLRAEASNALEERGARLRSRLKRRLSPKVLFLAVHRHQNTVYYKRLQPAQYRMLMALQAGATLEEACAGIMGPDLAAADLGSQIKTWFEDWASLGWFCRLK